MSKVKSKKLSSKDKKRLDKMPSEKDKTLKVIKEMQEKAKSSKKAKATREEIESILSIAEKSSKKAKNEVKDKAKDKARSKDKAKSYSAKDIKVLFDEYDFPAVITTRELTRLIQEETGYILGQDLTAGSKNLRRYLRTLDSYNDGEITYYRWNVKDTEDLAEIADILDYYSTKASRIG
jgi:hypothetical protein